MVNQKVKKIKQSVESSSTGADSTSASADELIVKVKHIQISDTSEEYFDVTVAYRANVIIKTSMMGTPKWVLESPKEIAGSMFFDPSNYSEMSLLADEPLVVTTCPKTKHSLSSITSNTSTSSPSEAPKHLLNCCNVDIFPIFIDQEVMLFEKRLEPAIERSALYQKSWCNLPLITLEVSVKRNQLHNNHHEILKDANFMKISVIGAYNMFMAYDPSFSYSLSTHLPCNIPQRLHQCFFENGQKTPRRFNNCSFLPSWESLKARKEDFTKTDDKINIDLANINNDENIDLLKYFDNEEYSIIWGSFHRTLFFGDMIKWFNNYIRSQKWQLEMKVSDNYGGYGMLCPISLFNLLYPGETKITLAVSLLYASEKNYAEHDFEPLFPDGKLLMPPTSKVSKLSVAGSSTTSHYTDVTEYTGADGSNAFVLVEVSLYKPLKNIVIPPIIPNSQIKEMLEIFENTKDVRICTGRGYHKEWENIVKLANEALRRVPYYGTTDLYAFNRQLSESRTRIEIKTSFWQKASKYVNENFVLDRYIHNKDTYNELLSMAHVCLMREVGPALINAPVVTINPTLRAARHARQLQCTRYASHLYKQVLIDQPNNGDVWRELATCYKDFDIDCAFVCMQQAMACDCIHPLSLLSMGCMIMKDNLEAAEPLFEAILSLYPFYITLWYCTYCYYIKRELFDIADSIMDMIAKTKKENLQQNLPFIRGWEHELGDWWDPTPITPSMNVFYEPIDLLLRLRAFCLADVCLSQAMLIDGEQETPACRHLLALSCRLRGDYDQGLCHARLGKAKFGQVNCLNSLEGECLFRLGDEAASMAALSRAGYSLGPYGLLLSIPTREYPKSRITLIDLVRRQPSAYAWMALASDWLHPVNNPDEKLNPIDCAIACAVQALKYDRSFAYAWVMLAKLVDLPERRNYCRKMADSNRYTWLGELDNKDNIASMCCVDYKILQECERNLNCNENTETENIIL